MRQYLYLQSITNYNQGISAPALTETITQALQQTDEDSYPEDKALLYYTLALNYAIAGDYGKSFSMALQAAEHYKTLKNKKFSELSLMLLGNISSSIKDYNLAGKYYQEALLLVQKPQSEYYQLKINMFHRLLFATQRHKEAIDSLFPVIAELKAIRDTGLLSVAYLNLGASFANIGDYNRAFSCYDTLLSVAKNIDNKKFTLSIYQNLGAYYYQKKDFKKAHEFFLKAKNLSELTKNPEQQAYVLYNLSFTFKELGYHDSAYSYLQDYCTLNNRLFSHNKSIEAYQSYVSVLLEASQNKLTIAEQKLVLRQRQSILLIIIAIAVVITALLLSALAQQKKRAKDAENKELTHKLEQENKITLLQEEKLQTQVREITSYSMLLSTKNNILEEISKLVNALRSNQSEVAEIKTIIQHNLNTDSDWKTFLLHFEKVHPDFFQKLKAYDCDLTKNDLKFCAYLRMGIDAKEIAQILSVSYGSIRMHKYRIKKKLHLPDEQNLDDFLGSL